MTDRMPGFAKFTGVSSLKPCRRMRMFSLRRAGRSLRSKLQRPRQALGLPQDVRDRLIRACPDTLTRKRNRAMIAIGYDTLCRRRACGMRVEDSVAASGRGATILLGRAKNDPFGSGRLSTFRRIRANCC